jgi:hypothetical protein
MNWLNIHLHHHPTTHPGADRGLSLKQNFVKVKAKDLAYFNEPNK